MRSADAFMAAVRHHQQGQLDEADRLYRKVLAAEPRHVQALHLRGALAHAAGRNEEAVKLIGRAIAINGEAPEFHYNIGLTLWALSRRAEAAKHWERAVALNPNFAEARMNLGNALREEGRFEEAIAQHQAGLAIQPQSAALHNSLGLSLAKASRDDAAIPHYARAIALQPALIDAYLNLAMSHFNRGDAHEALAVTMRSIAIAETAENKTLFARLVSGLANVREDLTLRRLLTRALTEGWSGPSAFATTARTLILHGPMRPLIERAGAAWPGRLAAAEFGRRALEALNDPLLLALMDSTVVNSVDLEKFLAACRFVLLGIAESITANDGDEALLGLGSALARQCFINEYVYAADEAEEARARQLRDRLDAALAAGDAASPLWVAAVASYFPLSTLTAVESLAARNWPAPVITLLAQQVHGPRQEAALRATIRQLTPIDEGVSRAVQAQYEANPYPRWIRTGTPPRYPDINTYLRDQFPAARFQPLQKAGRLDILIAGCGTGQHAILTRRQHDGRMLAIDLSRSSLAYAATKTRELGLDIDYAQADIMRLGSFDRRFDLIESAGVLHHMADPYAGWRVLVSLLRPGGFMRIGLYSEIARAGIVAARTQIAREGYGDSAAEIRRFRRDLMRRDDETARSIMDLRFVDFYSISECRDLLFHTQEHRMTWPEIKGFLAAEGLHLIGLEVDRAVARQYAMRFPEDVTLTDLDRWDAYERDNPHTFKSMYRFWVQKPVT